MESNKTSDREEAHMPLKEDFRASGHGATSWYGSSSQMAAANRVLIRQGTGDASAPEPKAATGSAGHTEHDGGG